MEIDKTTLLDLSIFNHEEEFSIFHKLNFTRTTGGREKLMSNFSYPLKDLDSIIGIQHTIKTIRGGIEHWPMTVTNGTLLMILKFYESSIDDIPANATATSAYSYKLFHSHDFSLVKYSTGHCFDLLKGLQQIISVFDKNDTPVALKNLLHRAGEIMKKEQFEIIRQKQKADELSRVEMLHLAYFLRYNYKQSFSELQEIYFQLDAWYSMAVAMEKYNLVFPEFLNREEPTVQTENLYHLLLPNPVSYGIELNRENNFLFLTGANMAGKSTFIKAVGVAVFMAHLGMPVPAKAMQLTLFNGMLSNINVMDNIVKGESYFYNEVQRIKNTILKINDGRKWLILIDELFKGTNVQDAMRCSTVVIEGLIKISSSLFILSTHLYEIGESLKAYPNIAFKYFETTVEDEQLKFSYQLKDGISNDRLGYLILKREKVLELLEKL
ncbi:MAG: DNA mismatch repair protein MutS [Chitinophagaceae bacterium]